MKLFDPNGKFYKGNTHCHTTMSDGRVTPEECMGQYRAAGYDFLAITDHWRVGQRGEYRGMTVLSGVEYDWSFPAQVLHMVCLFARGEDSQGIERGMAHPEVIRRVNGAGGVCIAAHPAWSLNTPDFLASLDGVDIAEVYNTLSDEPFNGPRGNSEGILDVTAAGGKLFHWVACDDSHFYEGEQCVSYTMAQAADNSPEALLDALRAGRFYASQGPEFFSIERRGGEIAVETSPVSRITFLSNRFWVGGRCRHGENLTHSVYQIQPGENWIRVQITGADGKKAWSSPVAVEG